MLKFVVYSCDSIGSLFLCFKWVLGIFVRRERKRYDGNMMEKKREDFSLLLLVVGCVGRKGFTRVSFQSKWREVESGSGQAVAIRVTADRCAFYNCRFLGWQDTLYLHYGKQYLKDCYIEGSVDFIFGNSTALLEHCHIHCKSAGYITAQSRKSSQETTGYVFLRCVITGNGGTPYTFLGRPWGPFGRVVFAFTYMDGCIKHVGWNNWGKTENERSACFYEYRCFGPGSCPSKRVTWARELMDEEADQFLKHCFIDPDQQRPWLAQRMALRIPYSA